MTETVLLLSEVMYTQRPSEVAHGSGRRTVGLVFFIEASSARPVLAPSMSGTMRRVATISRSPGLVYRRSLHQTVLRVLLTESCGLFLSVVDMACHTAFWSQAFCIDNSQSCAAKFAIACSCRILPRGICHSTHQIPWRAAPCVSGNNPYR